ncbi:MAG: tRNA (adenosine(37)-N6)-threonylcarbamoyltransferase complex ATPase subunit type 1 TsaE [Bacteroidales bacterium]|jgi:tRNA threonylcarbamoyladenosine biosynthesis protein TsaE|nr:tRNA (adenosine(37)-N6)-threonylcarbamoyltransferase complex ATPase subunit type 1 TsaE [Bacteroidales bacterium]
MRIVIADRSRLRDAARQFLKETAGSRIFAFYGQMGSGKTTIIKAICNEMGVADTVTSPTFTLVNEYRRPGTMPVYHFDFYRIRNITEVLDFGIEEYFDSGAPCFMEWPELIEPLLPPETMKLTITVAADGSRIIGNLPAPPAGATG